MNLGAEFGKWYIVNSFAIDYEEAVHLRLVGWKFETDGFVDTAADTVAANGGFENFLRNHYPKSLTPASIGCKNQGENWRTDSFAFLVDVVDAATRMETVFLRYHSYIIT